MSKKENKKKLPYNTFRKGIVAGILGLTLGVSAFGLAGCSDGVNGKDGAKWLSGTATPTATQGVDGDFYLDTDDYKLYQKENGAWVLKIEEFGKPGSNGSNGSNGTTPTISINGDDYWVINGVPTNVKAKGEDGTTPTITIVDGYWAINGTKTSTQAEAINGTDGEDGNIWTVGVDYPTAPNTGDMFLNNSTWDVYQYNGTTWEEKGNIKGDTGATGGNGQAGKDGTNIYVGYDGYVWQDGVRTTFKFDQDTEGRENVVEDTIGAYTTMGYWQGEYVDLSASTIALMANYKPNAKLTQYSGTKVTEIQVVAENAGTLHIGTAKVADVVNARTNCTTYSATTTSYEVTAGVNTITLDLTVAEDETIVLGGSGSDAKVYVVKNLPVSDEQGNFALMDGTSHTDILAKTGDYADTLAVSVRAEVEGSVALFEDIITKHPASTISSMEAVSQADQPYCYMDYSYMSGRTITKIGVPVKSVTADSGEKPHMTVYKVKTSSKKLSDEATKITIYFPEDTTANSWAYAECNIEIAEDETLAFGSLATDTLVWGYSSANESQYYFYNNSKKECKLSILFDVYYKDSSAWTAHLANLAEKEATAPLRGYL